MEAIYENEDFKHSSINTDSHCKGSPTVHQERAVTPSKGTKVLLIVLSVSVVIAVGGLCVLGVLYFNKHADSESWKVQYNMVLRQLSDQDIDNTIMEKNLEELTANFTTVRDQLSFYKAKSCHLSKDGWTVCSRMFYFSPDKQNWSKSRDVCISKGADLVTIKSQEEQDFLVSKIKETHWIGLNDLETEGRWVWVNNQTLEETGVKFWFESRQKEPDNWKVEDPSGENCASLGDGNGNLHTWFDGSCKKQKKFICEKKY
ncbi:CD209 antigen-like protein C DC-SIGN-related protein 2 [Triplophysa tibetana]|uniref:CD209 antigen-like protein C DC-SIGN-related protein 2 n=1 Tax=Triplophysa tibetana TaxID=1572043 RepID=A0A5A9NM76_9TELE|nr:CD209 antigen-like protein C DC-SIGN-related protein 2 [Triplophysa tibetana]